jgi:5-methylcytosine-specific restriction protein A
MRNPAWTRDELILALDLYFRINPLHTSEKNPEIVSLSEILNKLPIHADRPDAATFRNPNAVYMKLCNFLRLDPSYPGKGLEAGSRGDEEVWKDFATRRDELARVAEAIKANVVSASALDLQGEEADEAMEGRILVRQHLMRERNPRLVKAKKEHFLRENGSLYCEVCSFDFSARYGSHGQGYIECHHVRPLSTLIPGTKTKLDDLALVCANCHRMLHRGRRWLSLSELRGLLRMD